MKKVFLAGVIILGLIVISLAWYIISPLFIDRIVNEDLPVNIELDNQKVFDEEDTGENLHPNILLGSFIDADSFHKVSGNVFLIELDNKKYLRFEDFSSTNGPDLFVYVAKDIAASEFVNLGELKGNIGNQNYEIPEDISLEEYPYVLVWCKQFSVLFGSAKIN